MVLVAAGVVAMFPSMKQESTSQIIAKLFLESDMEISDFSWRDAMRYVHLTCSGEKINNAGLTRWTPIKRFSKGPSPGMNSRDVTSKETGADSQWIFDTGDPNEEILRRMMSKVRMSIGLNIYTFGGVIYHQSEGGFIGSHLTIVCARLLMVFWNRVVRKHLEEAGIIT